MTSLVWLLRRLQNHGYSTEFDIPTKGADFKKILDNLVNLHSLRVCILTANF